YRRLYHIYDAGFPGSERLRKLLSAGDPQASVGYKRHFVTTFIIDGKGKNGKIFFRMRKKANRYRRK
ncbi:MAG: hypothetical protein KBG94_02600, partial [Ruminococcus sp.]|nr:hypothetical protein [Ruminococcus sp.]